MRSRNIKPGFFKNEDLADCDPLTRLLFIGLWCLADRCGRFEYRSRKIKAEVLPYDNCRVEKMMEKLSQKGFIKIYEVDSVQYVEIINFKKHQICHIKEVESNIPTPDQHSVETVLKPDQHQINTSYNLILNTDTNIHRHAAGEKEFAEFWKAYPSKIEKKYALKCWLKLNGKRPPLETILEAIQNQKEWRENANGQFRPEWKHPATWINKGCWDDETEVVKAADWRDKLPDL